MSNNDFVIENGELTEYHGTDENVTVPDGVEVIKQEAFAWGPCKPVSVILPSSVKKIERLAFMDCDKLESINIPENAEVDPEAFSGCSGLTDERGLFVISGKLVALNDDKNMAYFTPDSDEFILTIPEDVTEICNISSDLNYAFSSIEGFYVTDCIEKIDSGAFAYVSAINCFRIIDHKTQAVLYESSFGDEFNCESLWDDDDFCEFCENIRDYIKK